MHMLALVAQSDAHLTGDQEVVGSILAWSGNILSWRLIITSYFLYDLNTVERDVKYQIILNSSIHVQ